MTLHHKQRSPWRAAAALVVAALAVVFTFFGTGSLAIETVHPRNVHRLTSRPELVDFLATAAVGGQIAVLSYEPAYLDLGWRSQHVSTFSAAAYEARKDRRLAFGLLGPWMQTTVERGILMKLGCDNLHDCELGLRSQELRDHLDASWKLVATNCTAASAVERCFLFPDPKFDRCCLARHATGHGGGSGGDGDATKGRRGFHVGRWLREHLDETLKGQRRRGRGGVGGGADSDAKGGGLPASVGHFVPALRSRDKAFEAAASGRHDHDLFHAHGGDAFGGEL